MSDKPDMDTAEFRKMLKAIGESADVRAVFGEPTVSGDRVVIPVARVRHSGAGGFGGEAGDVSGHECTPECPPGCCDGSPEGAGAQMGFGYTVAAEPVGVIEVTADDVYWIPTLDVNRLAVIGAIAGAVVVVAFVLGRVVRR
ncbi:MAG TPA: hypothetical protein VFH17_06750 [Coriobacteriia bacterium]|nr:hypothetical protein [Coriobacteriia bacterium]